MNDPARVSLSATDTFGEPKPFIMFHLPDNEKLLAAVGTVALHHAHLDHSLRLMIKTLANVSLEVALADTEYDGSATLRDRVRRHARAALGESPTKMKIGELMKRCKAATRERNELIHRVWCREYFTGQTGTTDGTDKIEPLPTVEQLEQLAKRLVDLVKEVQDARLGGYVTEALIERNTR